MLMSEELLIVPMVHLNGTSKESLMDALERAHNALYKACDALIDTAPNGRDYYPMPAGSLAKAQAQHRSRLDRLQSVVAEIATIWEELEGTNRHV